MNKKPCPFCGENRQECLLELFDWFDAGHIAHIHCHRCMAKGPEIYSEISSQDAIQRSKEAWNRRQ